MARIVVAGGGICGIASALMLARDGHDVTVLERDEAPLPEDHDGSWTWDRRAVAQFRIAHVMLAGGHRIMLNELPDVVDRLRGVGGLTIGLPLPAGEESRPDDDRFETVTARRPVIEWIFANIAAEMSGVDVRRGAAVDGLVVGPSVASGIPHITGVRLSDGNELTADLVIDATGRRSPTVEWLTAIGARPPVEQHEDLGFTYTNQFFRSHDGSLPDPRPPLLCPCGSISLLAIPSDNGTWSATLYTASNDASMRKARRPDVFERIWRSFPEHAHWVDGEPISEVTTMSGTVDRSRQFVVDDAPVATGMLSIADAYACTNPSVGRGMTIGLMHTVAMRDAVRMYLDDPVALAVAFDAATTAIVEPWHDATRSLDRGRMAEIQAILHDRELEPGPEAAIGAALAAASLVDGEAARWFAELVDCLTLPQDLFARPGVLERVLELAAELPPPAPYGPDRRQLMELVA